MSIDKSVRLGADGRERDLLGPGSGMGKFCLFLSCSPSRRVEVY